MAISTARITAQLLLSFLALSPSPVAAVANAPAQPQAVLPPGALIPEQPQPVAPGEHTFVCSDSCCRVHVSLRIE